MDVTAAVIEYLQVDTRITDRVGDSIFRGGDLASFKQLPAITVTKIDDLRGNHSSTSRYSAARVQCSSYAKTDAEADEVSELIADALDVTVNTVMSTLKIISCFDAGVVPDSDPKKNLYVYHRDFRVTYSVRI